MLSMRQWFIKNKEIKPNAGNYFVGIDIMRSPMALLNADNKIHLRLLVKDKNWLCMTNLEY